MAINSGMAHIRSPLRQLFTIFIVWKTIIWCLAYFSPGIGYDTSSDLLARTTINAANFRDVPREISYSVLKFVRWDAIYFTEIARRGHVYEQEWAFGKGISSVLASLTSVLGFDMSDNKAYAITGILVSHLSHWLSVVLVFSLARSLQNTQRNGSSIPFIAAVLHVISPAGIFLSAPYCESLFSFLNMFAFYLYAQGMNTLVDTSALSFFYKLSSGFVFGLATVVRSNGILGGIPFFIDAIETTLQILNPNIDGFTKSRLILQLQFTVLAGCFVAIGLIYPQYIAYQEYCSHSLNQRSWCETRPPAIYTFVQAHYWNVGFLRYWTLSNIPLFLLAMPCLCLLIMSGVSEARQALASSINSQKLQLRVALPQLILALLAFTSYHVQIITRLSSGYPLWYVWVASRINDWAYANWVIRTLILYGLIQAALFGSFLPPA